MAATVTPKLGLVLADFDGPADIRVINTALTAVDAAFTTVPGSLTIGDDLTVTDHLTVLGTTALTGAVAASGGVVFAANSAGAVGSVYKTAADGVVVRGATGTTNDWALVSAAGAPILRNPTGTDDLVFADDVTITGDLTVLGTTSPSVPGDLIARQAAATQVLVGAVGSSAGVAFGLAGDTTLYRAAADTLRTDDALVVGGALQVAATAALGQSLSVGGGLTVSAGGATITGGASITGQLALPSLSSSGGLVIGVDTNLYRASANVLQTDDALTVAGAATVGGLLTAAAGLTITNANCTLTLTQNASTVFTANNQSTGSAAMAGFLAQSNGGGNMSLGSMSTAYGAPFAGKGVVQSNHAAGLMLQNTASGPIQFYVGAGGATLAAVIDGAGNLSVTTGYLSVGAAPAGAGTVRLPNGGAIWGRNPTNTADMRMIQTNVGGGVEVGLTTCYVETGGAGEITLYTSSNNRWRVWSNGSLTAFGLSAMGNGTINAVAVYDNDVLLTDDVFEPGYALAPIAEMAAFVRAHRHLPTIPGRSAWETEGRFSLGKLATHLWETVEVQALYITELADRVSALEGAR